MDLFSIFFVSIDRVLEIRKGFLINRLSHLSLLLQFLLLSSHLELASLFSFLIKVTLRLQKLIHIDIFIKSWIFNDLRICIRDPWVSIQRESIIIIVILIILSHFIFSWRLGAAYFWWASGPLFYEIGFFNWDFLGWFKFLHPSSGANMLGLEGVFYTLR